MADDKTIRTFTAVDIEKYHKGQLSAKERHDLEKAALDDPFLADALDGYAVAGVNAAADLDELKQKLAARTSPAKVIPFGRTSKPFPWLRAAVMVVLIAGAGLLVYQFAFNNTKQDIALLSEPKKDSVKDKEVITTTENAATAPVSTDSNLSSVPTTQKQSQTNTSVAKTPYENDITKDDKVVTDSISSNILFAKPVAATPAERKEDKALKEVLSESENDDRSQAGIVKQDFKKLPAAARKATNQPAIVGFADKDRAAASETITSRQLPGYNKLQTQQATNFFRGRIVDSNNNPLPYANITNVADNVGTYSDVKGNFVLISPDSVLNVQVRSLGFADNYIQLQNQAAPNQVMMEGDRSLSAVVISNKKSNTTRSRNSNMVLEEPEPLDGWSNYDTYLANNLRVPEIVKNKQTTGGEVQLSFEVNKNGEPVNITVDRSLCESCDKEAIRLLKEGPRWKRKTKKNRTSVTISF